MPVGSDAKGRCDRRLRTGLVAECGGMAEADITVWAEALRASTHAHRQEIDVLMPWASLLPPERLAGGEAAVLLATTPTLAALPEHCEAISRLLANRQQDGSADLAPLMDALEQSADAARSLSHRLAAMADLAKTMFDSMEFGFLFDADRQLLSIGYRDSDGSARCQFLRPSGFGSAAGQLHRHRQGRFARQALVPAGTHLDADRRQFGPDLLVRIDVRISDAVPGDARARGQSAG